MGIKAASAGTLEVEFVVDLMRLKRDMDQASGTIGKSTGVMVGRIQEANREASRWSSSITQVGKSSRLQGPHLANLSYQLNDIGVSLASGQNPMMVFIQQGSQIVQIAQQSGVGLMGMARSLLAVVAPFTPLIALAGAGYAAFSAFNSQINSDAGLEEYARGLGLTQKEMEKLGSVSVTTGDMIVGLWRTVRDALDLSGPLASAQGLMSKVGGWTANLFKGVAASIYGLMVGSYRAVVETWQSFPAALGDLFIRGVNAAVRAIEGLTNAAIDAINSVSPFKLARVSLGQLTNTFEGAAKRVGASFATNLDGAVKEAISGIDRFIGRWGENSAAVARERIGAAAREIIDDRAVTKVQEAKAQVDDFTKGILAAEKAMHMLRVASKIDLATPWKDMQAELDQAQAQRVDEAWEDLQARQRRDDDERQRRLLDTAYQFSDIVGGGLGAAVRSMLPLLDKAREVFGSGSTLSKLALGAGIGGATAAATGGSALGGAAGGALGGKLGERLLTSGLESLLPGLGQFAGPIGSIAGGLLGGVVGGLLKKTKSASATVEIMAGDAMTASIAGNSGKLKAVAGGLADSLISGLTGIADQLGGILGDGLRVSIGQRKDTFRVDLSGMGRTKSMPSFKTEEEAVAFAIQSVIQQGAIVGLRAGTDTLLRGRGDLEAQLQKALSFEGVFSELERRTDPVGFAMKEIAAEFAKLEAVFKEAGASAEDFAKLQELRALREAEAIPQAEKAIEDVSERLRLERELLELQGNTAELRRLDLEALQPANRALQERIFALRDEQAATAEASRVAAEAAQAAAQAASEAQAQLDAIAAERAGLQRELMQVNGDTAGLLALERDALHPSNRALFDLIQSRKAEIAAAEEAARAADDAARAAEQLREAWASVGDGLMEEVRRIRGLGMSDAQSFAQLQGRFNATTIAARAGDIEAAKQLTGLSRSLLDAAGGSATSAQELRRIEAMTAASLQDTLRLIGGGASGMAGLPSPANDSAAAGLWSGGGGGSAAVLLGETVVELRTANATLQRMEKRLERLETNSTEVSKNLGRVIGRTGGDAIATREVAA